MKVSNRKNAILALSNAQANDRLKWKRKNKYFHEHDIKYLSFLITESSSVLDLGCGVGDLLASLKPFRGVGVDISDSMIENARRLHPEYEFIVGDIENPSTINLITGTFDYIVLSDTVGCLDDCQATLNLLHKLCNRETRIIISYYSYLWGPILRLAEMMNLKMPQANLNYLQADDIVNLLMLADYDVVKKEWRQLLPRRLLGVGDFINRHIAPLPFVRRFCLRNYVVGRSLQKKSEDKPISCSIVIPCRNEKGNIENAIKRIPEFCNEMEIIFVEGHSKDGTLDEIKRVQLKYREKNIKVLQQDGKGKADAVYKAFYHAVGDVLMILDADLTMPPEQLDKFWHAISTGKGEYIHGSRLVYPLEKDAMRFLNMMANHLFSILFSWLLNQRYTDTLCGTKVLRRSDYIKIRENQSYFGDFDPFGDFDLIFGSSKLNLKMIEIPITYKARSYGDTQISRFRHGLQLFRMVKHGYQRLKAF